MANSPSPDKIMFLGVASSEPGGFPLAIGMGFPDTNQTKNILICPPKKWKIFDPQNNDKDEIVGKFRRNELLARGVPPEEAAALISSLTKDRKVYSLENKHDELMIHKLCDVFTTKIVFHSALALFNELANFKRAMEIVAEARLTVENYPRNPSEVKWMVPCFHKCWLGSTTVV
jgi:hypothetical protein